MMRKVNYEAGWYDLAKGEMCLVLECGHVQMRRFEGEFQAPAEVECLMCDQLPLVAGEKRD